MVEEETKTEKKDGGSRRSSTRARWPCVECLLSEHDLHRAQLGRKKKPEKKNLKTRFGTKKVFFQLSTRCRDRCRHIFHSRLFFSSFVNCWCWTHLSELSFLQRAFKFISRMIFVGQVAFFSHLHFPHRTLTSMFASQRARLGFFLTPMP